MHSNTNYFVRSRRDERQRFYLYSRQKNNFSAKFLICEKRLAILIFGFFTRPNRGRLRKKIYNALQIRK